MPFLKHNELSTNGTSYRLYCNLNDHYDCNCTQTLVKVALQKLLKQRSRALFFVVRRGVFSKYTSYLSINCFCNLQSCQPLALFAAGRRLLPPPAELDLALVFFLPLYSDKP